jgi:WS/DGAT/MGAT family acyltransferase
VSYAYCDPLSAVDATFLAVEDANAHMHIGSVALFEAEPLRKQEGLDFDGILQLCAAQLHKAPRFRQKIAYVPGLAQPVWIDDACFNLRYHLRHTALPAPGDERQLKRLAGRIMSQQLDRGKPLWEVWIVEGVEGDRVGVIWKLHHCMADGISGIDLMNVLMGPDPHYRPKPPAKWVPRPAPSAGRLLLSEARRRVSLPFSLLGRGAGSARELWRRIGSPRELLRSLGDRESGPLGGLEATPLNVEIGPHRRFDWASFDLAAVLEIRALAGAKLNDVVLSVVAGALRAFLRQRGVRVEDLDFRVGVPVSVRSEAERGTLGNRVSGLIVRLPLDETDPWKRLLRVADTTHELKGSGQVGGAELIESLAELVPSPLLAVLTRFGLRHQPTNLVVTNVPGSPVPVYMLGARMLAVYPVVPLAPNQGLGVALLSYAGGLYWGFNSDWDAFPDLHDFAGEIQVQFEELRKAAMADSGRARNASE